MSQVATQVRAFTSKVTNSLPPHAFFLTSAIFHYLGPAFAVLLFHYVDVLGVAWLRIASAAVVFAVWRRPWRLFHQIQPDPTENFDGARRCPGSDEWLLLHGDK